MVGKGDRIAAQLLSETLIPEAALYIGKKVLGYDFLVTKEGVERAVRECGEDAVRRFFANGIDAVVNGAKVSERIASES